MRRSWWRWWPRLIWKTESEVFGFGAGEPVVRLLGLSFGPHAYFGLVRTTARPRDEN